VPRSARGAPSGASGRAGDGGGPIAAASPRDRQARTSRVEGTVQILIMFVVAGAAGPASFTHVHNVASRHGQPGWLAWADAVVLELMSIASGLELRRRKRASHATTFPAAVLGCAVTMSLSAQVVEAEASLIGWIAAAIPALGFLVMVKIALGHTSANPPPDPDQQVPPGDSHERTAVSGGPRSATTVPSGSSQVNEQEPPTSGDLTHSPVRPVRSRDRSRRSPTGDHDAVRALLPTARATRDRLAANGHPLTRGALARELRADGHRVSNNRASALLKILNAEQAPSRREPR
jgi:Protein of unknown function (DUF2637)